MKELVEKSGRLSVFEGVIQRMSLGITYIFSISRNTYVENTTDMRVRLQVLFKREKDNSES